MSITDLKSTGVVPTGELDFYLWQVEINIGLILKIDIKNQQQYK